MFSTHLLLLQTRNERVVLTLLVVQAVDEGAVVVGVLELQADA